MKQKATIVQGIDYPVGHLRAWLTVAGGFLLTFCSSGIIAAFGVFQDFYTETWLNNYSASQISWIGGTQLLFELCLGPVSGILFDKGYFRHLVFLGSLILSFSFFMLSLCSINMYYQVFLAQGVGMGIGIGFLFLTSTTVVSRHFYKRKALAMGIVSSGASSGGIVYSILLNELIHSPAGFAWGVRITAFITLGGLVIANLLVTDPAHVIPATDSEASSNGIPKHDEKESTQAQFSPETTPPPSHIDIMHSRWRDIWDIPFILTLVAGFLFAAGSYFNVFYIQLYARLHGINAHLTYYSIAILNGASCIGRIIPNHYADKVNLGPQAIFVACVFISGLSMFTMLVGNRPVGLAFFAILTGFFTGGGISVYMPMVASLNQNSANIGRRIGYALVPIGIANLIGAPLLGAILGSQYNWIAGVSVTAVIMFVSSSCVIAARAVRLRDPWLGYMRRDSKSTVVNEIK